VYGGPELGPREAAERRPCPSDTLATVKAMGKRPSRIELLELDIDLRLADLWGEAVAVDEWSLDVVAALMRAAYGKGYCAALTEADPGSLCRDHGYVVPRRGPSSAVEG
jgi:hypothetical protein